MNKKAQALNPLEHVHVRTVRNHYGSAYEAWNSWRFRNSDKGLWGNPIRLQGKIHVYGINLKSHGMVDVEFTDEFITVLKRVR